MHPQLQAVIDEFGTAQARVHALATSLAPGEWLRRPEPARWSIAECVAHLNLTSAAFVPILRRTFAGANRAAPVKRYHRDPIGWLLWRTAGPPVRIRVKTAAQFIPSASAGGGELIADFDRWQRELVGCVQEADGLPLGRLWIRSPFDQRIRYNAYSALTMLPRHQHRHLWQAEQVAALPR